MLFFHMMGFVVLRSWFFSKFNEYWSRYFKRDGIPDSLTLKKNVSQDQNWVEIWRFLVPSHDPLEMPSRMYFCVLNIVAIKPIRSKPLGGVAFLKKSW